jgi:hypothetical protein
LHFDVCLVTGVLILAGSLFAWASGAGDTRDMKDTAKAIVYQNSDSISTPTGKNRGHTFKNIDQHVEENRQLV